MLLVITGFFLLALGLFAGGVLVAGPLGAVPWGGGATLWVLFPVFSIAGYVLFAIGGRAAQVRGGSLLLSGLLIALALASAAGHHHDVPQRQRAALRLHHASRLQDQAGSGGQRQCDQQTRQQQRAAPDLR
ncbi:MAG: hypothetical protein EOO25_19530, partial [Comamonadaceae bacterium]